MTNNDEYALEVAARFNQTHKVEVFRRGDGLYYVIAHRNKTPIVRLMP